MTNEQNGPDRLSHLKWKFKDTPDKEWLGIGSSPIGYFRFPGTRTTVSFLLHLIQLDQDHRVSSAATLWSEDLLRSPRPRKANWPHSQLPGNQPSLDLTTTLL